MLQLFQTRDGPFFFTVTLVSLFFFLLYHQKIIVPYIVLVTARLSLASNKTTNVTVVSDQGWTIFFHRHTYLHGYHQKIFIPYIVLVTARLSLFHDETIFLSFKRHCLQLLQLFQTRDGTFLFIVTLAYTCRAFFAVSSEYN